MSNIPIILSVKITEKYSTLNNTFIRKDKGKVAEDLLKLKNGNN